MTVAFLKDLDKKGKALDYDTVVKSLKKSAKDFENFDMNVALDAITDHYNNVPFCMASRLVRLFAADHNEFLKRATKYAKIQNTSKVGKDHYEITNPLAFPIVSKDDKGKSTVVMRVFKNISVNSTTVETVKEDGKDQVCVEHCTPQEIEDTSWLTPWPLTKFYNDMQDDLADAGRAKKWETTARAASMLKSYQDMTVAKYLTQHTDLKNGQGLRDSQIRDFAANITDLYMPIKVSLCEKLEDYINVYETGPTSCAKSTNGSAGHWRQLYDQTKHMLKNEPERVFHPAVWYHYNPAMGLAYIKRGGNVVVRSITVEHKGKKYYTHVYSSDGATKTKFDTEMKRMGYTHKPKGSKSEHISLDNTFDQPAVEVDGVQYCPIPYTDILNNTWKLAYKAGVFSYNKLKQGTTPADWHQRTNGFMTAASVMKPNCDYCGNKIGHEGNREIMTTDGKIFCGKSCAQGAKYYTAMDGEGHQRWIHKDECYPDPLCKITAYSNIEAALRNGAVPVMTSVALPEDTSLVSTQGYKVTYKGMKYAMSKDDYHSMAGAGLVGEGGKAIKGLMSSTLDTKSIKVNIVKGDFRIAAAAG